MRRSHTMRMTYPSEGHSRTADIRRLRPIKATARRLEKKRSP